MIGATAAEKQAASTHATKVAQERLAAGESLDSLVQLVWRQRTLPGGEVESQGPYLVPKPGLGKVEVEAGLHAKAKWHTLFDLSQGLVDF
jgi:hypothetical protein